jgi:hypothetical protein
MPLTSSIVTFFGYRDKVTGKTSAMELQSLLLLTMGADSFKGNFHLIDPVLQGTWPIFKVEYKIAATSYLPALFADKVRVMIVMGTLFAIIVTKGID